MTQYQLWRELYNKKVHDTLRWWRRISPIVVAAYIGLLALSGVALFKHVHDTLALAQGNVPPLDGITALSLARISMFVGGVEWGLIAADVALLTFWILVGYVTYLTVQALGELVARVIAPTTSHDAKKRARYTAVVDQYPRRSLNLLLVPFVLVAIVVISSQLDAALSPSDTVDIVFDLLLPMIPLVYGILWSHYLYIRHKRSRRRGIDWFLFSNSTLRSNFRGVVGFLVVLGVFGRVLVPSLFGAFALTENTGKRFLIEFGQYDAIRTRLLEAGYTPRILEMPQGLAFPPVSELGRFISPFPPLADYDALAGSLQSLQSGFFLVITLVAFASIGLPSALRALLIGEQRRGTLTVLGATAKSFGLVVTLQIFIKQAYFVDFSNILGISAVFFSWSHTFSCMTPRGRPPMRPCISKLPYLAERTRRAIVRAA